MTQPPSGRLPTPDVSIDAVTASVDCTPERLIEIFGNILGTEPRPGTTLGGRGYDHAVDLARPDTERPICKIETGHRFPKPNIFATGTEKYDSPRTYSVLETHMRGLWLPSRLDVALDWDDPGAFDLVNQLLVQFALDRNVKLGQLGDWTRGLGRTRYLYSRTGRFYVRLYEYRQYHGYGPECRLEVECKPNKPDDRARLAAMLPWDIARSCPAVNQVLRELGIVDTPHIVLTMGSQPPPTLDRDRAFLCSTAWPALMRLMTHHYGDLEATLLDLANYRAEREMQRQTIRDASIHRGSTLTQVAHNGTILP